MNNNFKKNSDNNDSIRLGTYLLMAIVILLVAASIRAAPSLVIQERGTHLPLTDIEVWAPGLQKTFLTDSNGTVNLDESAVGSDIKIIGKGYILHELTLGEGLNKVQLTPDHLVLKTMTVRGHGIPKKLSEVAGSYSIVTRQEMDRFNDESLVRSMNTVPGIRFEERSPGSYRLSVRGSLRRARFDVRNVKVYWNDLPYTDPFGSTPLHLLDLNNTEKVEIIKGPAGSAYGAGLGGVLNISGNNPSQKPVSMNMGYSMGSNGYSKYVANAGTGNDVNQFSVGLARQSSDGYRDHTFSERNTVQLSGTSYPSNNRRISAHLLYSDLFYELPGGLTLNQYDSDPTLARSNAGEKNTYNDKQNTFGGVTHDYKLNKNVENITSLYFSNGVKETPFFTNHAIENLQAYGGRSTFNFRTRALFLPTVLSAGAEYNYGDLAISQHNNVEGLPDGLQLESGVKSYQGFLFLGANVNMTENWMLNVGGSLNFLQYNIKRLRDTRTNTPFYVEKEFDPELVPRIGVVGKLTDYLSVHSSVSSGFSSPTIDEVHPSSGVISTDLQAEKGINYEAGVRGNLNNNVIFYDLTGFWMEQSETIVGNEHVADIVTYENVGNTTHLGGEALAGVKLIDKPKDFISLVKLQTSYTHHRFTFDDYKIIKPDEVLNYSENELPGVAPHTSVTSLDLATGMGLYLNTTYNFTDRIPLNNTNTVYADSYQLVTVKSGYKTRLLNGKTVDLFLGVDNLLNEKYSLGNDLNPWGQRYYNPSPERNYFAGVRAWF